MNKTKAARRMVTGVIPLPSAPVVIFQNGHAYAEETLLEAQFAVSALHTADREASQAVLGITDSLLALCEEAEGGDDHDSWLLWYTVQELDRLAETIRRHIHGTETEVGDER